MQSSGRIVRAFCWVALLGASALRAADPPYFITYSHHLEEPGNLEISVSHVLAKPDGGNRFLDTLLELEYGATGWWTTELYLSGQATAHESTVFTGYRWENRFRVLMREHWINPVLYVEFENITGANKSLKEVVGFDGNADLITPNADARHERKREAEAKLILGSNFKGWNVSENFIAEKNLNSNPWEFGYAVGVSRPLALAARPKPCRLCPENFRAGVEMYGGLGTAHDFRLHDTSHYVAPGMAWQLPNGTTVTVSPTFGVSDGSARFFSVSACRTRSPRWAAGFEACSGRAELEMRLLWVLLVGGQLAYGRHTGTPIQQAPAAVASWQNPYSDNHDAKLAGQKLFQQHCAACHGSDASGIQRIPALISPTVNDASPGALFWVLRNGSLRRGMPSFSNLPEERRWQIVTYLKSLQ